MRPDHRFTPLQVLLLRQARDGLGLLLRRDDPGFDAKRLAARELVRGGLLDLRGVTTGRDGGLAYLLTKKGTEVSSVTAAS